MPRIRSRTTRALMIALFRLLFFLKFLFSLASLWVQHEFWGYLGALFDLVFFYLITF
jgi:hypothetical protein